MNPVEPDARSTDARASGRLHMWGRPGASVTHAGTDLCRRLHFSLRVPPPTAARRFADLCPLFGLAVPEDGDGFPVLMAYAAEPCPKLEWLPAVAAAEPTCRGESIAGFTDDPRLVLAVLARCSGRVFLRDRAPSISTPQIRATLDLLVPRSWKEPR